MGKMNLEDYMVSTIGNEQIAVGDDKLEEIEFEFYYRLEDWDQLSKAKSKVRQEQWSIPFNKNIGDVSISTAIRARKCMSDTGVHFELCSKTSLTGMDGVWELEREIERHHFDTIETLSKQGMVKDRYYFPVNGTSLVWEVDVFHDDQGNPVEWVKVDLEVPSKGEPIPKFPLEFVDSIVSQKGSQTPEEIELLDKLYKNRFIIRKK